MDVINIDKAVKLMDGDKDLYRDLFMIIESSLKEKYENIEKALHASNADDLELYAHQFKGALRNVAAEEACSILEQLEKTGLRADFAAAKELYIQVRPAVERLLEHFHSGAWEKAFSS